MNKSVKKPNKILESIKKGLNDEQVASRIESKLTNRVENKNVKTYKAIFFSIYFQFSPDLRQRDYPLL